MFDDLHNSISDFTSNIIEHLMELYYKESCKDEHRSLFINIIIPTKKGISLPVNNKENIYHSDPSDKRSSKKFYSTSTKTSNITNIKSVYINKLYHNNPLILKSLSCNNINTKYICKLNHNYKVSNFYINKSFYSTNLRRNKLNTIKI
jgi:hypothetical protein